MFSIATGLSLFACAGGKGAAHKNGSHPFTTNEILSILDHHIKKAPASYWTNYLPVGEVSNQTNSRAYLFEKTNGWRIVVWPKDGSDPHFTWVQFGELHAFVTKQGEVLYPSIESIKENVDIVERARANGY